MMSPEPPVSVQRFRLFSFLEISTIVLLALVPLFTTFPYRVNIFLSWEGAYRISQGQIPYADFGMPLGYMYWVVPAIFFKIFGVQLITLVKAQVFINILSGLAFRSILKNLAVAPGIRLLSVVLYCISFSFFNFWPWYNHTVIVYQMVGVAFLTNYIFKPDKKYSWLNLSLSALFVFFSFFTKQDGGGLAFILCFVLLGTHCWMEKKWKPLFIFLGSFAITAFAIIAPLMRYNFGYWFNMGQAPHMARISTVDIFDEFFSGSQWIKFYLFLILLVILGYFKTWKEILTSKRNLVFLLLTLGILAEAAILQVTSYTPPDNNIFYHSFAFAFLLSFISPFLKLDFNRWKPLLVAGFGLLLWWSGVFWKYLQRIIQRNETAAVIRTDSTENIVNRHTYMIPRPSTELPQSQWTLSGLHAFEKVYMPRTTVEGIHRLLQSDLVKNNRDVKVLNMTELTPLAVELPYKAETGPDIPLWHHLGVGMFNRELRMYASKISRNQYDLVLYEYIPNLNNFYPFALRDTLLRYYTRVDSFPAPRRGEPQGLIEVYRRP